MIAKAIKVLQSNKHTFGIYLPTLYGLRLKIGELKTKNFIFCSPLIDEIEVGFEKRFSKFINVFNNDGLSVPLYLAMVSNPLYKFDFIGMARLPAHIMDSVKDWMIKAAIEIIDSPKPAPESNISATVDDGNVDSPAVNMLECDEGKRKFLLV